MKNNDDEVSEEKKQRRRRPGMASGIGGATKGE